jgi:RNA polymerase sigma-70 factor (ECF subfamily)
MHGSAVTNLLRDVELVDGVQMQHSAAAGFPSAGRAYLTRADGAVSASQAYERQLAHLLACIAQGDQQALATLYDATSAFVYGLAVRIVHDSAAAEDVTMEVYTQIYQQASHYEPGRGTPSAWIVTLTRSRALDAWRRESIRQHREEPLEKAAATPSTAPTPEEWSTERDRQRAVQHALALLCPEQRQAIEIAYYEGLSHSEIATRLGQPLGTVKTRIRTGMMALRDLLYPLIAPDVAQRRQASAACARVVLPFPTDTRPRRMPACCKPDT